METREFTPKNARRLARLFAGIPSRRLVAREPDRLAAEKTARKSGTCETLRVSPNQAAPHTFPAGYTAHWVRVKADKPCKATATFRYEQVTR